MLNKKQVQHCLEVMEEMYPEAQCELDHQNPFELVIAVLLSAQCTDNLVNKVTASLFDKYKTPEDYLAVPLSELEQDIKSIGLYRNKAKNIRKLCQMLIDDYGGEVPKSKEELMKLAGVGRKTANVVASVAFNEPAIAVDTHVERVAKTPGHMPLERFRSGSRRDIDEKGAKRGLGGHTSSDDFLWPVPLQGKKPAMPGMSAA